MRASILLLLRKTFFSSALILALTPTAWADTFHLISPTAAGVIFQPGQSLSTASTANSGFTPTLTLDNTLRTWYSPVLSGSFAAGTWNLIVWSNDPGCGAWVTAEIGYSNPDGSGYVSLGSQNLDFAQPGNHPNTFNFTLGFQNLVNKRLRVSLTQYAGCPVTIAYNAGVDFDSRLITPAFGPNGTPTLSPTSTASPTPSPTPLPPLLKSVDKTNALVGQTLTYTLHYRNPNDPSQRSCSDPFEVGNTAWPTGWTPPTGGVWNLINDNGPSLGGSRALDAQITGGFHYTTLGCAQTVTDGVLQVDAKILTPGGELSLLWRQNGSSTYQMHVVQGNAGNISLRVITNGAFNEIAVGAFNIPVGQWITLRLEVVGFTLRAYINGTLLLTATDPNTSYAAGAAGLEIDDAPATGMHAVFDNVSITQYQLDWYGVRISDTLPAGLSYLSDSCGATVSGNFLSWNLGTLPAGAQGDCLVRVRVNSCPATLVNQADFDVSLPAMHFTSNQVSTTIGCASPTPTPTPSPSRTATPTFTPSATPSRTVTPTFTPSATPSRTPTPTASSSATPTSSPSRTATLTFTPSATQTATLTWTPSFTATFTSTPTPSRTATLTDSPTLSPGPTATFTDTATATPTWTPTSTLTFTSTPTPSRTATPTDSPTLSPGPTATFTDTATATPTWTPTSTATFTSTLTPSRTATPTGTPTYTATPVNTSTWTPTATPTRTVTATTSATPTATCTATASPTLTQTPTATTSNTPPNSPTMTPTPVPLPFLITINVFNAAGERVRGLWSGLAEAEPVTITLDRNALLPGEPPISVHLGVVLAGETQPLWDGRNDQGQIVSGGVYYVKVEIRNPFGTTQTTTLPIQVLPLSENGAGFLDIFNGAGERVASLRAPEGSTLNAWSLRGSLLVPGRLPLAVELTLNGGDSVILSWDGLGEDGEAVASGAYIVRARGNGGAAKQASFQVLNTPADTDPPLLLANPLPVGATVLPIRAPGGPGGWSAELFSLDGSRTVRGEALQGAVLRLPLHGLGPGVYLCVVHGRDNDGRPRRWLLKTALIR